MEPTHDATTHDTPPSVENEEVDTWQEPTLTMSQTPSPATMGQNTPTSPTPQPISFNIQPQHPTNQPPKTSTTAQAALAIATILLLLILLAARRRKP